MNEKERAERALDAASGFNRKPCPESKGTGRVEIIRETEPGNVHHLVDECSRCNGTGADWKK